MDVLSAMTVFVRVIELQSFSLAASDLGVSSSSVSKQVSHLEAHVGAALLERTTRRLSVTEAGAAYYEKCQHILSQVEAAESLVAEFQGAPRGLLKVNSDIAFGALLLAKVIPEFSQIYPGIQLEVVLDDGAAGGIKEGFDLAFRFAEPALSDDCVEVRELVSVPQVICATPEYIALHGEPQRPADLVDHNCLVNMSSADATHWVLSNSEGAQVVKVNGNLRANNELVITSVLLGHQGIARIAGFEAKRLISQGEVSALLMDYDVEPRGLCSIVPQRQYKNAKADLLIVFVEGWVGRIVTVDS